MGSVIYTTISGTLYGSPCSFDFLPCKGQELADAVLRLPKQDTSLLQPRRSVAVLSISLRREKHWRKTSFISHAPAGIYCSVGSASRPVTSNERGSDTKQISDLALKNSQQNDYHEY